MTKKKTIYTIGASFLVMLIMAITENSKGILIPTYKEEFGVGDTWIGIFLLLSSFSYVVFTHFAGNHVSKHGQKKTIILGMVISSTGFLITSFVSEFWQFMAMYVYITAGISFIIISLNTLVPLLRVAYISVVMNTLHFFYGVGATITQKMTGVLLKYGIGWREIFVGFALIYLVGILAYIFVDQPKALEDHDPHGKIKAYEQPLILLFGIALGFYVTAEMQTANWLVNYLGEMYQYTEDEAAFYTGIFFISLAAGRLFGGYVLEKIGYMKGIIASLALAFVFYTVGLVNEQLLILVALSGLFFAIIYPTVVLVVQDTFKGSVSIVLARVTMIASAISMVFGFLLGLLNDLIGVKLSIYIIPGSLFASLAFVMIISGYIRVVNEKRLEGETL